MKPLFTVHAGELLVGHEIENQFSRVNVWVPAKDRGIDLLVSNNNNKTAVSQLKNDNRDFTPYLNKWEPIKALNAWRFP